MIQIENLNFWYKKGYPVFSNLNLLLNEGHIYGLLGKNGSGKSTLLKSIAGLTFPISGKCLVNGMNSAHKQIPMLQDMFFIPEDIYTPALTPAQFLKNTAVFYPRFSITDFYANLKTLDVDAELVMSDQSHGQQKKAMIAFGLATNSSILIMDEPTNGLDIPSKVQFRKLIAAMLTEERCIIISTHQIRDLDSLIDTILILDDQQIVVNSTIDDITEQLLFGVFDDTAGLKVLYQEETLRGKYAIVQNTSGKYSKIDLELFFNGVTSKSQHLIEALKAGGRHE